MITKQHMITISVRSVSGQSFTGDVEIVDDKIVDATGQAVEFIGKKFGELMRFLALLTDTMDMDRETKRVRDYVTKMTPDRFACRRSLWGFDVFKLGGKGKRLK